MRSGCSVRAVRSTTDPSTPEWTFGPTAPMPAPCLPDANRRSAGGSSPDDAVPVLPGLVEGANGVSFTHVFAARSDLSSARLGAELSTTTRTTRRTTLASAARSEIRYVPGVRGRPCTRPRNGTRFTPRCPRTVKCPIARQSGDTRVTVKTTRLGSASTNVTVVRWRRFGPVDAIHVREDWACATLACPELDDLAAGADEELLDDPAGEAEPGDPEEPGEPDSGAEPPAAFGGAAVDVLVSPET
jgi:hypothetical protein